MLGRMNTALSHRGPDDEGIYVDEAIALGHRRLSIIDLSSAGHQPMSSGDGRYQIIYNGELYNYLEIKNELTKHINFTTNTDTEVILKAYIHWGAECLNKFNGMYAFAIWDRQKKELFIARDRLGIKPLYYYNKNGIVAFSSEVRALLTTDLVPRKLNQDSLCDYLRYQTVHAPNTILQDVFMLLPGHYMLVSGAEMEIKKYWDLTAYVNSKADKSYKETCSDVNSLLYKAVERRLIADVPFGAFLSGGIDSSIIVGMMSKISTAKVKTFSVVFEDEEFSEAKYARLIARKFNTDHHEIKLTIADFIKELPDALMAMDHPSGDGPNSYVVSKATKNAGITMALSGLGGDELFAGYDVFKRALELENKPWLNAIPPFVRGFAGTLLNSVKPGIASEKIAALLKQKTVNPGSFYPLSRQVLMDEQILKILKKNSLPSNRVEEIANQSIIFNQQSIISSVSFAEISTYMQNVLLRDTDQMSMASALEVRVPFLDYQLVEYVLGIPDKYKIPTSPKKLLIDSVGDLLPDEIVNRPKMGFTFPWKHWLKNDLKAFCEQKMSSLSKREMFNSNEVMNLWQRFLKDDPSITWSRIWHLVVLESWMQENQIE